MIHGGEIYGKEIVYDFSVNLNPIPCPDSVIEAMQDAALYANQYPDINQNAFRSAVCDAENCCINDKNRKLSLDNIIGGSGASELFAAIAKSIRPKKVLFPVPCFYGYYYAASMTDAVVEEFTLKEESGFTVGDSFIEEIDESIDLIFIANPNNPTGRALDKGLLERLINKCRENGTYLVVDECFYRLSDAKVSARDYLFEYDRLIVVDAYTKLFSIPGARVGFGISSPEIIKEIRKYLPEWNMSVFSERAGEACAEVLIKTDFVHKSISLIRTERDYLFNELKSMGIKVYPSDANFLLINCGEDLYEKLLNKGILIRECSNFTGLEKNYYRVAIKDHKANDLFIRSIKDVLK
ncbi:MAG: histidinol-phosphate aminotransferase family protein [Butyrivibrio sp.]|nr:histidinol-phosphate aminotransferase family protein [Butyrivibrio sp.]